MRNRGWSSLTCLPCRPTVHGIAYAPGSRSEEHTSELQSQSNLVCRLLLEKKKKYTYTNSCGRLHTLVIRGDLHISACTPAAPPPARSHKASIFYLHATSRRARLCRPTHAT